MKTQHTKNLQSNFKEEANQMMMIDKNNDHQIVSSKTSFCSADLWNLQRSRKTGITYRKHL